MVRFLLLAALLTACATTTGEGGGGVVNEGDGDASAQLACSRFRTLSADVDLMTSSEQRRAAQGVWDKAQYSTSPGIRDSARAMLGAITSGDMDALRSAVQGMTSACAGVGS